MVSMVIREYKGVLKCTSKERDAFISAHPDSAMAAKLAAEPNWNSSSTLLLEPGAAAGKDKYFDAEQLMEQTKLAMDVFDATHMVPGRWAYFPCASFRSLYPCYVPRAWPQSCMAPPRVLQSHILL